MVVGILFFLCELTWAMAASFLPARTSSSSSAASSWVSSITAVHTDQSNMAGSAGELSNLVKPQFIIKIIPSCNSGKILIRLTSLACCFYRVHLLFSEAAENLWSSIMASQGCGQQMSPLSTVTKYWLTLSVGLVFSITSIKLTFHLLVYTVLFSVASWC